MPRQKKPRSVRPVVPTKSTKPIKPKIKIEPDQSVSTPPSLPSSSFGSLTTLQKGILAAIFILALISGIVWTKYRYLLVVATVNGESVSSVSYLRQLHQAAGPQIAQQMVMEKLILQQAKNQNISISAEEFDQKVAEIETQFAAMGGLDMFLETQGISKEEFEHQVRLNIYTEKIAGTVDVSDEDVEQYYNDNAEFYTDIEKEEALTQVRLMLEREDQSTEIQRLLEEYQNSADIRYFLPGL